MQFFWRVDGCIKGQTTKPFLPIFVLHSMKNLFVILSLLISCLGFGQDSLRVMYYNLLNFPSANLNRIDTLVNIIDYAQPDVFVVCELEDAAGANTLLNEVLNVNGTNSWQGANFVDGGFTSNMLFYNSNKLGLISQDEIGTVLRDINTYVLYYKAPNLSAQTDTIYLNFFACHLKAGSSDYQQRNTEIQQAKFYMNSISDKIENVIIGGDMNVYSGFESAVLTLKNSGDVPLFDPIDVTGNWSSDWTYADVHTQSTRTSSIQGGAGGGMDDRFDLIFVSEDVLNNDHGVKYINNSYTALGQDGNHFNDNINDGFNSAVPDDIADALYYASDHLPVIMDLVFDETASITKKETNPITAWLDADTYEFKIKNVANDAIFKLFDSSGRQILEVREQVETIKLPVLSSGMYLYKIRSNGTFTSGKLMIP